MQFKLLFLSMALCAAVGGQAQTTSPYKGETLTKDGGKYFVYNPAVGLWMDGNNTRQMSWTTSLNMGKNGELITFVNNGESTGYPGQFVWNLKGAGFNGTGCLESNSGENFLWWDTGRKGDWDITPSTDYFGTETTAYPNSYVFESGEYILGAENDTISLRDESKNIEWQLVTLKERLNVDSAKATADSPVDLTYTMFAPYFKHGQWGGYWIENISNYDGGFGLGPNTQATEGGAVHCQKAKEYWSTGAYDFYQVVTGLPNGTYRVGVRGFYRDGASEARNGRADLFAADNHENNTETLRAIFYANSASTPLMSIFGDANPVEEDGFNFAPVKEDGTTGDYKVPNNLGDANLTLWKGHYQNYVTAIVTDGTLKIGVKKDEGVADDWTVFSDFSIEYMGSEIQSNLTELLDALKAAIADAEGYTGSVAPALKSDFDAAIEAGKAALTSNSASTINNATAALNSALANVKALATSYDALAKYVAVSKKDNAAGDADFTAAITAAENVANTSTVAGEMNDARLSVVRARKNFHAVKVDDDFQGAAPAAGTFYIYNVGAKRFLAGGSDWGTHAAVNQYGILWTLAASDKASNAFTLNSDGGADNRYLHYGVYVDTNTPDAWVFTPVAGKEGVYNIQQVTEDGSAKYLAFAPGSITADGVENSKAYFATVESEGKDGAAEVAQWKLVTEDERRAIVESATKDSPKNASYMLSKGGFDKFDNAAGWTDSSVDGNHNVPDAGGRHQDFVYEGWNTTSFDLAQTVGGLPEGYYTVSCSGFYRDGNRETHQGKITAGETPAQLAYLYVDGEAETTTLASISDGIDQNPGYGWTGPEGQMPDDVWTAANYFECGLYWNTTAPFQVIDEFTFGVGKAEANSHDWIVLDNFTLTYYGTEKPDVTGINGVETNVKAEQNGVRYNLAGQRVGKSYRGIVIMNGKKMVVK